jgi:hypothetical protein
MQTSRKRPSLWVSLVAVSALIAACTSSAGGADLPGSPTELHAQLAGEKGVPGVSGEAGSDGLDGLRGPRGLQGIQGVQGIPGFTGPPGGSGLSEGEALTFEPSYMPVSEDPVVIAKILASQKMRLVFLNLAIQFQLGFSANSSPSFPESKQVSGECALTEVGGSGVFGTLVISSEIARKGDYLNSVKTDQVVLTAIVPAGIQTAVVCFSDELPAFSSLRIWPTSSVVVALDSELAGLSGITTVFPWDILIEGCLQGDLEDCLEFWSWTDVGSDRETYAEGLIVNLSLQKCQDGSLRACQVLNNYAETGSEEKAYAEARIIELDPS